MYMVEDDVLFIMNDGSPAGFRLLYLLHLLHLLHSFIVFTVFIFFIVGYVGYIMQQT